MSQIMKSYLGIFLIVFMVVCSVGILSAFVTVMDAQDLHARIISEIEDSDYSGNVIRENFEKAGEAGYQLSVTLFYENGDKAECHSGEEVPSGGGKVRQARIDLAFPFQVAFFGINHMHSLSGYAR